MPEMKLGDLNEEKMYKIIGSLNSRYRRKFFYSEMDFLFCLGWALKEAIYTDIIFKRKFDTIFEKRNDDTVEKRQYIDILLIDGEDIIPIELKYKTKGAKVKDNYNHDYLILDQSATDGTSYGFVEDISKIEQLKKRAAITKNHKFLRGYAIILTNDQFYYKKGNKSNAAYQAFYLYEKENENRILKGTLTWEKHKDINLRGEYNINKNHWRKYSSIRICESEAATEFKYLLFEIK